jgi:hypothetical protein
MNNFSNNYNQNQLIENFGNNNQLNTNYMNNQNYNSIPTENYINLANNIDTLSLDDNQFNKMNLNGTALNNLSATQETLNYDNNSSLIKSLTKEIISNLKENNMDIYDNLTIKNLEPISELIDNDTESISKKKKKHKKDKTVKDELKEYVEKQNPLPSTNNYLFSIFDDCFNLKDFIVLFAIYFLLSQEMVKDFFSKYFTCISPDDEGKVNLQGIIVYGLILTILFMLSKKLSNIWLK